MLSDRGAPFFGKAAFFDVWLHPDYIYQYKSLTPEFSCERAKKKRMQSMRNP
jgi:hypothetical protein